VTVRKSGSIFCPTFSVNVWPLLSSFWRWPSMRWPKISWKKTPAARPERMAGPTNGSATGAFRRSNVSPHPLNSFMNSRRVRQPVHVERFKGIEIGDIHAVFCLGARRDDDARVAAALIDLRAFGVDEVAVI